MNLKTKEEKMKVVELWNIDTCYTQDKKGIQQIEVFKMNYSFSVKSPHNELKTSIKNLFGILTVVFRMTSTVLEKLFNY